MSDTSRTPGDGDDSRTQDDGDTGRGTETGLDAGDEAALDDVPDWEDEYLDRVSDRLLHNYDLEKDRVVEGERFTLYGRMELHSQKHFFHPALSFAHHESFEHLFVRRMDRVDVPALERFVDLGHRLAEDWIEPNEEHFCTEFTFVAVVPTITESVGDHVAGFRDRTMLKMGYNGHYEVNLLVVAPDEEELVASENADVAVAFRLWEQIEREEPGILGLIARRLQL